MKKKSRQKLEENAAEEHKIKAKDGGEGKAEGDQLGEEGGGVEGKGIVSCHLNSVSGKKCKSLLCSVSSRKCSGCLN